MPFIIDGRRGGRIVAAVITALALSATPAMAYGTSTPTFSTAPGCTTSTTQAFLFTNDRSDYVPAPGGTFEGSLAGWSLTGGAATVAGSAPVVSGARLGAKSLLIPNGGSVTSAPMCIGAFSPYFRFQARKTGAAGSVKVDVLYLDGPNYVGERTAGYVTAGGTWAPTNRISLAQGVMGVNGSSTSQATVAFRFTAVGGGFQVDDLYVDPFRRF